MARKKQMQHFRAARLAKRLKREAKEEEYLPRELIARVDAGEEQELEQLAKNASDSDLDSDSEDSEEDCEITDSEEQDDPIEANASALEILIASSQKHSAFDRAFAYQRGSVPTETLFNRSRRERELRKAAENTPTLHTFFPTASGRPAVPSSPSPTLSTNERKQQECFAAIAALEKKLASKKECGAMNGQTLMRHQVMLALQPASL